MKLRLENANFDHVESICKLINTAYRGNDGWTTESTIVDGDRTTPNEIELILTNKNKKLLIAHKDQNLISCICIEKRNESSYMGMFAVDPVYQGVGIGKEVLSIAEEYSVNVLKLKKLVMVVVSSRTELISYYERRGYLLTEKTNKYPTHLNVGTPKVPGLNLVYMEKNA